jgi:hypothetical protein
MVAATRTRRFDNLMLHFNPQEENGPFNDLFIFFFSG